MLNDNQSEKKIVNRRQVLKRTLLGGSAVTVVFWKKPVVKGLVLPAHAGTTMMTLGGSSSSFARILRG